MLLDKAENEPLTCWLPVRHTSNLATKIKFIYRLKATCLPHFLHYISGICYFQIESSLGYGNWVCSLLLDTKKQASEIYQYAIYQMSAIPAASDSLARYTGKWKIYTHSLFI